MSNLIANAIKFSPVDTVINIKLYQKDQNVVVEVQDQGIGIPSDLKDKLFNPEAQRPGTAGETSFGMGLSIAKQLIAAHAGKIWFESKVGVGTTFFVSLPIE